MLYALWFLSSDRIETERGYVLCVTALVGTMLFSVHSGVYDGTDRCSVILCSQWCVTALMGAMLLSVHSGVCDSAYGCTVHRCVVILDINIFWDIQNKKHAALY